MDKELLEYLQGMESRINERFDNVELELKEIKKDVKVVYNQTARITEYMTSNDDKIKYLADDITNLKSFINKRAF